jgi:hypothetical protein
MRGLTGAQRGSCEKFLGALIVLVIGVLFFFFFFFFFLRRVSYLITTFVRAWARTQWPSTSV